MTVLGDGALEPVADCDAAEVYPQSLRTNEHTARMRPTWAYSESEAIPIWVVVLDQGGSEAVDQIAFFPLSSSKFLRLIKSPRIFPPWVF